MVLYQKIIYVAMVLRLEKKLFAQPLSFTGFVQVVMN